MERTALTKCMEQSSDGQMKNGKIGEVIWQNWWSCDRLCQARFNNIEARPMNAQRPD